MTTLTAEDIDRIAEAVVERLTGNKAKPLNVQQAAQRLGVSTRTVRRMIENGDLKRVPGTNRTLITATSLQQLIA